MTIASAALAELEGQEFPGLTLPEVEAEEAATLRLSLTDDRILDSKLLKRRRSWSCTSIAVVWTFEGECDVRRRYGCVSEHGCPGVAITVRLYGLTQTGYDDTKKKAKQR